jgi:acetolactate synthase small subunit
VNSVQHLELDVVDDPSVLLRIVSVCHQRRFRIASLRYERFAGGGRLILGVEAELTQVERLEHWLASLIHVLAVRAAESADSRPTVAIEGGAG